MAQMAADGTPIRHVFVLVAEDLTFVVLDHRHDIPEQFMHIDLDTQFEKVPLEVMGFWLRINKPSYLACQGFYHWHKTIRRVMGLKLDLQGIELDR